jgi:hypothetical protein
MCKGSGAVIPRLLGAYGARIKKGALGAGRHGE